MGATIRRTTTVRSEGEWGSYDKKDSAIRAVVAALAEEMDCDLKATNLTVTTKPGRYVGSVKVEAKLSMGSR